LADERVGTDTIIEVGFARPVSVSVAEEYVSACPHYAAETFAVVAG